MQSRSRLCRAHTLPMRTLHVLLASIGAACIAVGALLLIAALFGQALVIALHGR